MDNKPEDMVTQFVYPVSAPAPESNSISHSRSHHLVDVPSQSNLSHSNSQNSGHTSPESSQPSSPSRPFSKSFFQRNDATVKNARSIYLKVYLSGLLLVIVTIFAVFPIYWGSLWKVPAGSLNGWIVDFDGGDIGQAVTQGLLSGSMRIIKWDVVPSTRFPQGSANVISAVKDEKAWVAITINPGASSGLLNAVQNPDAAYNGSQAVTMYGIEARNENAYRTFIRPFVQTSLDAIMLSFATGFAAQQLSSSASPSLISPTDLASLMSVSPQTVINPAGYTIVNILPFNQPVASAVVFVGLIYLLILSFFIVMVAFGARQASGMNEILTFRSLVTLRLVSSAFGYFFLSLFYSLLNLAFKLDLTRKYGNWGFIIFWMLNWVGMLSVGLALESLITLLTPQFIPFFMILWIIVNVSVCIFPIDMLPRIYHYGYAAPFLNISKSTRSLAFATKNSLGLNFGVLIIWVLISCITLPVIQWFVRRRDAKELERKQKLPPVESEYSEKAEA